MTRSTRRSALVGVVLMTASLLAIDVAAPLSGIHLPGIVSEPVSAAIPSAPSACVAGWRQMPVPDRALASTPLDVVTREGRPAWILGGSNDGALALRWNGSAWKARSAEPTGHSGLAGGVSMGRRAVLAVGYRRRKVGDVPDVMTPIAGRLAGSRWADRRVPRPPGRGATLTDVAALRGGKAWAVGTQLRHGTIRAYAVRWTGRRWLRDGPTPGGGSGLVAVERAPGGRTWAVGWKEASLGQPRPFIVRRSGDRWEAIRPPSLPQGRAVLTDVRFTGRRSGWAVGYLVARGGDHHTVLLLRWDGSEWSRVPLPWADDFSAIPRSLAVGAGGAIWIAGTQLATEAREARGYIARRQSGAWRVDLIDMPPGVRSEVMSVAATRWGAIAGGSAASSLLVLHSCGAPAGASATRRRARIKVSDVRTRRRVPTEEDVDGYAREGEPDEASPIIEAAAVSLAAPIRPRGFMIRDRASRSGLAQRTKTYGGFAADVDGDGDRDVFIGRHGKLPRLAMNGPDGFVDAPTTAFSDIDRHGCDSADIDDDGGRDIVCATGAARGKAIKRHELSLAPDTASAYMSRSVLGIADPLGRGRLVALLRVGKDPYPEAFVANAPDREDGLPGYNRFYRNVAGTFVPAPGLRLDSSHGAECVTAADIEGDGDEDLAYCTSVGVAGRAAGLRIMRNEDGVLKDRTRALRSVPIGDVDVAFADVTGDGRRDLIQLSEGRLRVSRGTRAGFRRLIDVRLSHGVAVAAGDVNGDDAADIYVVRGDNSRNRPDLLLVSRGGGRRLVSVRIPQTDRGRADDVFALDYDGNGRSDFVVLNGRNTSAGPIQLLAAFPG